MHHLLRHYFLPHHTNNFKAKVLHFDFFLIYIIVFVTATTFLRWMSVVTPNVLGYATDITIDALLSDTNAQRAAQGIPALKYNDSLAKAAREKAAYMFSHNYWAHNAPDGTTPWFFIQSAGYTYSVAGENLAKNFSDSGGVVAAWMNSPTHRENLLRSQYEEVGFAVVNGVLQGEETTLVVQMFGKPLAGGNPIKQAKQEQVATSSAQELAEKTPTTAAVAPSVEASPKAVETTSKSATDIAGSVVKKPLINLHLLSRNMMLAVTAMLILAFVIDAVYVWRRKIVRFSGRSSAHILFMISISGVLWFMSMGSIL